MLKNKFTFLIIFCGIFIYTTNFAKLLSQYSPEKLLGFSNKLIKQKDYYRAYIELQRLKHYHPQYITSLQFSTLTSYCLFKGKQYHKLPRPKGQKSLLNDVSTLFSIDSFIYRHKPEKARILSQSWKLYDKKAFSLLFNKRHFFFNIVFKEPLLTNAIYKDNIKQYNEYLRLKKFANDRYKDKKSPWLAFTLGVFPGLGYWYAGNKPTAIVSFVMTALTSALTYFAMTTGNEAIGYFTGAISVFFYGGSMLGGYLETKKHNHLIDDSVYHYMTRGLSLEEDRKLLFDDYGIKK